MDLTAIECSEMLRESGSNPIWIEGHGTRIARPGPMLSIAAPKGVRSFKAEEMTVTCGAGTPVAELQGLLEVRGQYVNLPWSGRGSGTVGGALAVGSGDVFRLGRGSIRDVLLQADFVDSTGRIVRAGGPTVKNVSGFDLCRLLVGSCGRVGLIAEVILRTRPRPMDSRWFLVTEADRSVVSAVMRIVPKPISVLWSGIDIHLCLEGHPDDIASTRDDLRVGLGRAVDEAEMPSLEPYPHRWLCSPKDVDDIMAEGAGSCLAEIGTGIIHHSRPSPEAITSPTIVEIESRILRAFDPSDRLNGGTKLWGRAHARTLDSRTGRLAIQR